MSGVVGSAQVSHSGVLTARYAAAFGFRIGAAGRMNSDVRVRF
jgi:hypothetical protein